MTYARFGLMIAVSTFVMFVLMYLNSYALDHQYFSQTRMWMAVLMGATMTVVMLGFMWGMYPGPRLKAGIVVGALFVGGA